MAAHGILVGFRLAGAKRPSEGELKSVRGECLID